MKIPLHSFEQYIDETILRRGFQYFKKGLVNEPEEIGHGEYEAVVEGTDQYTVRLTIKNDLVTEYVCTCPYDLGPVCKHVVAVIIHLQQNELNLQVKSKKLPVKAKTPSKKKTVTEQADLILEKLSHESLKEYVKEQCITDRSFRQLFIARYTNLVMPESQALYAKQVRAILKSAAGRGGFIEYSKAGYVGHAVYAMVQNADKQVELSNFKTAMFIACAVMEEMTQALQFADDSNGDIGGCIDPAIEILYDIAGEAITEELRKELFQYCLNSYLKGFFKGWDWHFTILHLAMLLVKDEKEGKQVHLLLDEIKPTGSNWDWALKKAQNIRLELIEKMEGKEKATLFLEQNINNSDFRKQAIEAAITRKDFAKAISLAEEGIRLNDKDLPGLANDWRDYLLKIYLILNKKEMVLKYARYLLVHSNREHKSYFDIIKKNVAEVEWSLVLSQIIKEISTKNRWGNDPLLANIYIWEGQMDKLLGFVKSNLSVNVLESYEKYLVNEYKVEISDLYQIAIYKYMEYNVSRNHYQQVCRYLRRMIKMGMREKANEIIQELRIFYPKRKALLEELIKV